MVSEISRQNALRSSIVARDAPLISLRQKLRREADLAKGRFASLFVKSETVELIARRYVDPNASVSRSQPALCAFRVD